MVEMMTVKSPSTTVEAGKWSRETFAGETKGDPRTRPERA